MSDGCRASFFVEKTHNGVYVKKCNNSNYLAYFALFWIKPSFYLGLCGKRKKYFFAANI
jgi:hypothetical protein